jgi:hypothetical protein
MEQKQKTADAGEIKVDTKSKVLFVVLGILIAGSIAVTYWRYMVKRDYVIQAQIDCDPETENCLVWKCDPASLVEGEECTGVPDNDIWYYKILNRNAKNIPNCDPKDENCTAYQCDPDEPECNITNCSPDNLKKGEECSTPEQYLKDNPPADETSADEQCAPDDEECQNATADENSAECDPASQDCGSAEPNQDQSVTPDNDAQNQNTGSDNSEGANTLP